MLRVIEKLWKLGAENIITYSLMVKRSSLLVPTFFGVMVGEKDRVYFQLKEMPNNRLVERPPFGILREVQEPDIGREIGDVGSPFIGITPGDFLYDKRTRKYYPYFYLHKNDICGFVSFGKKDGALFIDAWGTTLQYRRKGVGGCLFRWAETWARCSKCNSIELWAFHQAVDIYKKYGYELIGNQQMSLGADQNYYLMRRKLLYNTKSFQNSGW